MHPEGVASGGKTPHSMVPELNQHKKYTHLGSGPQVFCFVRDVVCTFLGDATLMK